MSWWKVVGWIEVALVLLLLAGPFWIVVQYPAVAAQTATMHATLVPWVIIVIIVLIFRTRVESLVVGIATAVSRLRSIGSSNTRAEFQQDDTDLVAEAKKAQDAAWFWYERYVATTIYGSQVSALMALNDKGARN